MAACVDQPVSPVRVSLWRRLSKRDTMIPKLALGDLIQKPSSPEPKDAAAKPAKLRRREAQIYKDAPLDTSPIGMASPKSPVSVPNPSPPPPPLPVTLTPFTIPKTPSSTSPTAESVVSSTKPTASKSVINEPTTTEAPPQLNPAEAPRSTIPESSKPIIIEALKATTPKDSPKLSTTEAPPKSPNTEAPLKPTPTRPSTATSPTQPPKKKKKKEKVSILQVQRVPVATTRMKPRVISLDRVLPTAQPTLPFPSSPQIHTAPWDVFLRPEQIYRLVMGFHPSSATDDQWFVYSQGPDKTGKLKVHFHRNWTGMKIAELFIVVDLKGEGAGMIVGVKWDGTAQTNGMDEDEAKYMVSTTCSWVLGVDLEKGMFPAMQFE